MDFAILRFEAPLMSFGRPVTSADHRPTGRFPRLSMITGMLANALGYDQSEFKRHQELQERISYAVREDVEGQVIEDFHTVRLDPDDDHDVDPHRMNPDKRGWTTWSFVDSRNKHKNITSDREYLADAVYTLALRVSDASAGEVLEAFRHPARPLYIGRKCCLPSAPLAQKTVEAESPQAALRLEETFSEDMQMRPRLWYESPEGRPLTDQRDWTNQIHTGQRFITCERMSAS